MKIQVLQVGQLGTNCYLAWEENDTVCTVVDPGGDGEWIASHLEQQGLKPGAVLLTHGHYDHTGGVAALQEQFPGIPVYLNHRDCGCNPSLFPPVTETTDACEGDEIVVGSLHYTVLETPGHSEGSVVYQCGSVLFCGDTLFAGSCGRTDLEGGSQKKILASLARLARLEGDYQVCPGHMETSTLDRERAGNPYMKWALEQ